MSVNFHNALGQLLSKKKRGIAEPKNGIVGALMLIKIFFNELSFLWNGCNIQYYYARNFIYYTISLWTSLILGNDRVLYIWKEVLYIGQQVVYTCKYIVYTDQHFR